MPGLLDMLTGLQDAPQAQQPQSLLDMIAPGNIDLTNRPRVPNKGKTSTVLSASYNIDGQEVLLPRISDDGRILSHKEAVDQYMRTGRHLGKFANPAAATAYAEQLHKDQERLLQP